MRNLKKEGEIAELGNLVLRKLATPVEDVSSTRVKKIIKLMEKILMKSNGVGLAAPQISESVCIMIIASRPSRRYPSAPKMDPVVMINPAFESLSSEMKKDWEGCLSIPEIRALVPRYIKIKISYTDQQGKIKELIADDFIARIFQHEFDHLKGLLFLDRVESNKDIISESEFQKIVQAYPKASVRNKIGNWRNIFTRL